MYLEGDFLFLATNTPGCPKLIESFLYIIKKLTPAAIGIPGADRRSFCIILKYYYYLDKKWLLIVDLAWDSNYFL